MSGITRRNFLKASGLMAGSAAAASAAQLAVAPTVALADDAATTDAQTYDSDYCYNEGYESCVDIVSEGAVLLRNQDNLLPLAEGSKVTLLGAMSYNYVLGGTGSAGGADDENTVMMNDAMIEAGLDVNEAAWSWLEEQCGGERGVSDSDPGKDGVQEEAGGMMGGFGNSNSWEEYKYIHEFSADTYEGAKSTICADGYTDYAIVTFSRSGAEGASPSMDQDGDGSTLTGTTYFELNDREKALLAFCKQNFKHTIVLVNSAAAMELGFAESDEYNVDGMFWIGHPGEAGITGVASLITGRNNPSGRLVDTYAYDVTTNPTYYNTDDNRYTNVQIATGQVGMGTQTGNQTFYQYEEGVYVGYRYFETAAAMGYFDSSDFTGIEFKNGKVKGYDQVVQFPFGFGLSYTTFDWTNFSTSWSGKTCTAKVTVANTGDVAGKDVVELYAQSPYTDYDRANGVEKSAVELVGYAKTKLLEPGESQELTVTFDESQLAAYDSEGAGTWVLDAGTYYVTAATDAHVAANNVLAAKAAGTKTDARGNASLVDTYVPANADVDVTTYAKDTLTGEAVANRLSDARGDVTYLTRADWENTFPTHDGDVTSQVSTWGNEINGEDGVSYTYGKVASADLLSKLDSTDSGNPDVKAWEGELTFGAKNGLDLIDLRGLEYDDPKWDQLLDELTPEDYDTVISHAGYGTKALDSVNKPAGTDADSTSGWSWGGTGMTFCNPMTVAQTWNQEIAYRLGNMIGNESLLGGGTGWYAPAMNIHRTPYSGRNGEYFSEDSFLSGAMASQEVRGAAEKGVYTIMKHFAFNEQENHRGDRNGQYSMATWMNEQSARELYLKPFEMCMKVGDVDLAYVRQNADGTQENATTKIRACQGLMTSFNRIGATWAGGSYDLITGIVRNEWGFDGWILTDNADTGVFMNGLQMIEAGADAKLTVSDPTALWSFDSGDATQYRYAREAMHHLLYVMANSHVMNGAVHGSVYSTGTAGMQKADMLRWALTGAGVVGVGVILGINVALELRRRRRG